MNEEEKDLFDIFKKLAPVERMVFLQQVQSLLVFQKTLGERSLHFEEEGIYPGL